MFTNLILMFVNLSFLISFRLHICSLFKPHGLILKKLSMFTDKFNEKP